MQQDRFREAIPQINKVLSAEPDDAHARGMLAQCLMASGKPKEARREAERAIADDPEDDYLHYVYGIICFETDDLRKAEEAVREALRLDPADANYYGALALILGRRARWRESLEVAKAGLEHNPAEVNCLNARTQALSVLGRKSEARDAIKEALQENSEESHTHTHAGYAMLRQGQVREATDHFKEALRLEPDNDYARKGMLEALRARFPVYRVLISFQTWLARMPQGTRYAVIFGLYIGARISRTVAKEVPALTPILLPLGIGYSLFVIFSWVGGPILNTTLLAHPLGRIALSRDERAEAIALSVLLLSTIGCFVTGMILSLDQAAAGGFIGLIFVIIVSLLNMLERRRSKKALICVTAYLGAFLAVLFTVMEILSPLPIDRTR